MEVPFNPPIWLRPPMVQTALASAKFRIRGTEAMEQASESRTLTAANGKRTTCLMAEHPNPKGLVILFHGWLGSPQSSYARATAGYLFDQGYSICRMTLFEHGESAMMNPEFIHSARDAELFDVVSQIVGEDSTGHVALMGYSLGANFALRVASRMEKGALAQVFAVSPLIDPVSAAPGIDANPLIRRYFVKKLRAWLEVKAEAFPDRYEIADLIGRDSVSSMSDDIVTRWTEFDNLTDYFNAYRLRESHFANCPAPIALLTAQDDIIVKASEVKAVAQGAGVHLRITQYGGHNGFFENVYGLPLHDRMMAQMLARREKP